MQLTTTKCFPPYKYTLYIFKQSFATLIHLSIMPNVIANISPSLCVHCCQYDRAVMSLGNVSNNGDVSTPANDSMVYIEWDVVVININDTASNDNVHWVSAGAAYDNDSEVWVGQMSFTAEPDSSSVSEPHGSTLIKFCCCREIVVTDVVVVVVFVVVVVVLCCWRSCFIGTYSLGYTY